MSWITHATLTIAVAATGFASACGGAAPGTRPDDMSLDNHLAAAREHEAKADEHEAQYDPDAQQLRGGSAAGSGEFDYGSSVYNPTESHLQTAERHREIAEQHRQAAHQLEQFEEAQCGQLPPETRAECPLLGNIVAVQEIEGGVRIEFADGVNLEAARAHVQCHVAHARTDGREGMDRCPMYVEGARAEVDGPAGTVDLVTDDPSQVEELRSRARGHLRY